LQFSCSRAGRFLLMNIVVSRQIYRVTAYDQFACWVGGSGEIAIIVSDLYCQIQLRSGSLQFRATKGRAIPAQAIGLG